MNELPLVLLHTVHQRDAGFVNLLRGSGADCGGVVGVSLQLIVDFVAFSLQIRQRRFNLRLFFVRQRAVLVEVGQRVIVQ